MNAEVRSRVGGLAQACLVDPCSSSGQLYGYAYDPVGNRTVMSTPQGSFAYSYNAVDELTGVTMPDGGTVPYGYDANGNETRAGGVRYSYNVANQLIGSQGGGPPASYAYDGDGNLVGRSDSHGTIRYAWDTNAGLPQLAVEQGGGVSRTYGYAGATLATLTTAGRSYDYLGDRLGSVAAVVDSRTQIAESYRYDPSGVQVGTGDSPKSAKPPAKQALNPMRFTGQYLDTGTGLYDLRARNYGDGVGRGLADVHEAATDAKFLVPRHAR